MKFNEAERTENFPLKRFVSEVGRWELGFYPVIFGVRLRMGVVGDPWVDVDYCCGANFGFQRALLLCILTLLADVDEQITPAELNRILPAGEIKPLFNDAVWPELRARAIAVAPSIASALEF